MTLDVDQLAAEYEAAVDKHTELATEKDATLDRLRKGLLKSQANLDTLAGQLSAARKLEGMSPEERKALKKALG